MAIKKPRVFQAPPPYQEQGIQEQSIHVRMTIASRNAILLGLYSDSAEEDDYDDFYTDNLVNIYDGIDAFTEQEQNQMLDEVGREPAEDMYNQWQHGDEDRTRTLCYIVMMSTIGIITYQEYQDWRNSQ